MLKKNLAVTLCALIVSTPITQALAAGEAERPGVASVPEMGAPVAPVLGHTLPQDPMDLFKPVPEGTFEAIRAGIEGAPAGASPSEIQPSAARPVGAAEDASGVIHQTLSAESPVENSAAAAASASTSGEGAVSGAWEKALELIGRARSKKLLRRTGGGDALAREAKEMQANTAKKPEAFIPDFYRGRVPLSYLSKIETELSPEEAVRVQAVRELVGLAMRQRPAHADPALELADMRDLVAFSMTEAGKALMEELKITPQDVAERVVDANAIDAENDIPPAVWHRAAQLGLMKLKMPKERGGMGFHQKGYAEVMKALPGVSGTLLAALSAQNTIATAPLAEFGTEEQKAHYLPKVSEGKFVSSFGLTEPGAGTDLNKMITTAVLSADRKSWRITGEKIFITGTDDAGMLYLVTGHTIVDGVDVGPTVLMVDLPFVVGESWDAKVAKMKALDKKGLRIMSFTRDSGLKLMMIHGSDQAFIQLKDYEVPVVRDGIPTMLGAPGEGKIVPLVSLNRGRAGFGPMIWASAQSFVDRALQWSADRKMFDMYAKKGEEGVQGNLEHVQTVNGRNGIKAAALGAVSDLTQALVDANPDKGVAAISAAIKARASNDNWDIAQDTLRLGGGHALFVGAPLGLERDFRDAWIALIVEGVNAAMSQFVHLIGGGGVQKEMMTPWRHPLAIPKFLLQQVVSRMGLNYDRGVLHPVDADWIQERAARFAWRFGISAVATQALLPIVNLPGVRAVGRGLEAAGRRATATIPMTAKRMFLLGVAVGGLGFAAVALGWAPGAISLLAGAGMAMIAPIYYVMGRLLGWAATNTGSLIANLRPFEKRQNALINAYEVLMDIYTLTAVQLKLAKQGKTLSAEEKVKLNGAVDFLKTRIDARMKLISVLEDPTERVEREVGAAMLKAELARQPRRENVVERHMSWLKEKTDAFFGGGFEGNVEDPSGIDGASELKSAQERAKAMSRFKAPQPVRWIQKLMSPLARWALRSRFEIKEMDFPEADRARLAAATDPKNAFFFGPVHPEFGTDWIIDKVITDQYAPETMHWAARDVVKLAPRLLSANNLLANDGGEAAKELSIQNARAGKGVLLHPEGTVLWTADRTNTIFPGIDDMAEETARREGPSGKPVYIISPVWKAEYTTDVSAALLDEMSFIEKSLRLPQHRGLLVSDRFGELQESILAIQQLKFGVVDPLPHGINSELDFFARQEKVRQAIVDRLKASHRVAESSSMEKTVQRLIKVIRAERKAALIAGDQAKADALKKDLAAAEEAKRLGKFTREIYGAKPTLTQEEIGESLKRLRADLVTGGLGNVIENMAPKPYGSRVLHVRIPEPIRVDPSSSETSEQRLARVRESMQGTLDRINAEIAPRVTRFAVHNPFYQEPPADLEPVLSVVRGSYVLRQHLLSAIANGAMPVERAEADERPAQARGDEAMRLLRALLADPEAVQANLKGLSEVLGAAQAERLLALARDIGAKAEGSHQATELGRIRRAYPLRGDGVKAAAARLAPLF